MTTFIRVSPKHRMSFPTVINVDYIRSVTAEKVDQDNVPLLGAGCILEMQMGSLAVLESFNEVCRMLSVQRIDGYDYPELRHVAQPQAKG